MQKTTAKVTHSDYMDVEWLAIEFFYVDFYGFKAKEMNKQWWKITEKQDDKYDLIYKQNKRKIKDLRNTANRILQSVKDSKPFYRFWYNKTERDLLEKADNLFYQADELQEKNNKIRDKEVFGSYEIYKEIENFLKQNGFVQTHKVYKGKECVEVWTLEE